MVYSTARFASRLSNSVIFVPAKQLPIEYRLVLQRTKKGYMGLAYVRIGISTVVVSWEERTEGEPRWHLIGAEALIRRQYFL